MEEFRGLDMEVKSELRGIKYRSFQAVCESLDPSTGLWRIWRTFQALASWSEEPQAGVVTKPDSLAIKSLLNESVRSDIPPQTTDIFANLDESDPMNQPFPLEEFKTALFLCKSSPGMDGLLYKVTLGFSDPL